MFYLYYNSNISDKIYVMAFILGMTADVYMAYILMLMSMTLDTL